MSDPGRRRLPAVHAVLSVLEAGDCVTRFRHEFLVRAARAAVEDARAALQAGREPDTSVDALAAAARERLDRLVRPGPGRVLNATGVVLHTGLGRAPLPSGVSVGGYRDLEIDRETGERGDRQSHVRELLCWLTGAEDAHVVNNNAAATLLAIAGTAAGGEAILARGQLVEIGGSFRMPEVIAVSGARLVEVGATNRVRLEDYRAAIGPETRALLEVHTSNYRIRGFTEQPSTAALAEVAHAEGLPLVFDIGSGCFFDTRALPGLAREDPEPLVTDAVAAGADLVCFSGDKLLGGPQAGIIVGRSAWVRRLATHPLARAVRIDKLALAALTRCLAAWLSPAPEAGVPALALLRRSVDEVRVAAERLTEAVRAAAPGVAIETGPGASAPGSGSLPDTHLDSWWVRIRVAAPDRLARALRAADPPVFALVRDEELVLDLRTILDGEEEDLARVLRNQLPSAEPPADAGA